MPRTPRTIVVTPYRDKKTKKVVADMWFIGKIIGFDPIVAPTLGESISTGALSEMHKDEVTVILCESFRWAS